MNKQRGAIERRPGQFSLSDLLGVVLLAGFACAASKYVAIHAARNRSALDPFVMLAVGALSTSACAIIGVVRCRFKFWLSYGLVLSFLIGLLFLLSLESGG
jgi:hypothetical protein